MRLLRDVVAALAMLACHHPEHVPHPWVFLAMNARALPSLSEAQRKQVLAALATLRLSSHDKFLLDLASALARCQQPLSDLDLRIAIRQQLGVVPGKDIVHERAD